MNKKILNTKNAQRTNKIWFLKRKVYKINDVETKSVRMNRISSHKARNYKTERLPHIRINIGNGHIEPCDLFWKTKVVLACEMVKSKPVKGMTLFLRRKTWSLFWGELIEGG